MVETSPCWICGDPGTTREHKIKRSDLDAVFGKPVPGRPLFLNSEADRNCHIQGLNSDRLKFRRPLCEPCNSARSQPYDRAWERFSTAVRSQTPPVSAGSVIRIDQIYSSGAEAELQNLQLYFVKQLGCHIADAKAPIDLTGFSRALLTGIPHPDVYLQIGVFADGIVGPSALMAQRDGDAGEVVQARWFYSLDRFAVLAIYFPQHPAVCVEDHAWHPRHAAGEFVVQPFDVPEGWPEAG